MKRTFRILLLGPYPPPRGGVQNNMLAIRDELIRSNHACSIISITRSDAPSNEPNVHHPRTPIQLLRLLGTVQYDLLHLHIGGDVPFRVLMMILACAIAGRGKSVMTFHSGGYASETVEHARPWSLQGFVFRQLTRIVVVNTLMITLFARFGVSPERIRHIFPFVLESPNPLISLPGQFQSFIASHQPTLLTVGLLEPHYDLMMQINAMEAVLKRFPHAGLIIVGSGSLERTLADAIASKSYASHILLAGDTDHDVVLHLINQCTVLLRTTVYDGDAISIREAIYLGTSVIATDTGMRPEGTRLIPKEDQQALEKAIISELENPRKSPTGSEDGRENIRQILALYEELLGERDRLTGGSS